MSVLSVLPVKPNLLFAYLLSNLFDAAFCYGPTTSSVSMVPTMCVPCSFYTSSQRSTVPVASSRLLLKLATNFCFISLFARCVHRLPCPPVLFQASSSSNVCKVCLPVSHLIHTLQCSIPITFSRIYSLLIQMFLLITSVFISLIPIYVLCYSYVVTFVCVFEFIHLRFLPVLIFRRNLISFLGLS